MLRCEWWLAIYYVTCFEIFDHAISVEHLVSQELQKPQYSRLCLRLNIRRVRKMFCHGNIQISLELHANYIHPSFTLQRSGTNSLLVVPVIFRMFKNILRMLRMFKRKRNRLYSRLCLRLNMRQRRVRKVFCNIQISLELHANYLRPPFTL